MELIETVLSPVERRAGATWVPWRDLAAQQVRRGEPVRALAPGDAVLLQAEDGQVHRGRVLRSAGSGETGSYVITFGAVVSRPIPAQERSVPVQDVEVRRIPTQRRPVDLYL